MRSPRINKLRKSKLFDMSKPLKLWGIDQAPKALLEGAAIKFD